MGQLLLKMLVGAAAGLAIWMIFEPFAPPLGNPREPAWELEFVMCLGMAVGLAVGALNGWIQGSRAHVLRGAGLGLLFGGIGASLGYEIGGSLVAGIFHDATIFINPQYTVTTKMFARVVAIAPIGTLLGLAIGASTLNTRRATQGALGGLIGGAVAGFVFDPVGVVVGPMTVGLNGGGHGNSVETGSVSRALTAVLIGALIALFIAIVDLLSRSAWVRLVLGRNEGKEWPIDSERTFIGRNERANIPLFGDPNIAPMHACIIKQGQSYTITDGGSPMGTYVNGQRIQAAPLFHGAQIQVGSYALQFLMKHGAAPARGPENFNQAYAIQNQPQPAGVAPFGAQPGYPAQPQTAAATPAPGSLYGSAPTQAMPAPSGSFAPQQPTVAFPNPASQPTTAFAPVAAGGFALVGVDGPLIGQRFPIRGVVELGRESGAIPMSYDTNASRRHASVAPGPAGVMVSDLGSTNGTFVNGQRVQSANAGPGDLIRIGATTFRVEPG
ncbi:MAG TPA: FHA domain-containing protein [Fimbriimonadaceae bacterium]|nr:FHA domain-containing protein [Fimbriimonadaceae bacterium]